MIALEEDTRAARLGPHTSRDAARRALVIMIFPPFAIIPAKAGIHSSLSIERRGAL
ncbi:MAG TPA: hypothetical protein VGW33_05015 [Terriglobia bacterium]|nr:hypothetical protein [Terriglobia bacterium]